MGHGLHFSRDYVLSSRNPGPYFPACRRAAPDRQSQRGVAAIEFALTVVLLLVIVFGIVSFGALFWAQQKLSNLAGEGARYALALNMDGTKVSESTGEGAPGPAPVCGYIGNLAKQYVLLQGHQPECSSSLSACSWAASSAAQCATVKLTYPVKDLPLVGIVGQMAGLLMTGVSNGDAGWMPGNLTASSTIQLPAGAEIE